MRVNTGGSRSQHKRTRAPRAVSPHRLSAAGPHPTAETRALRETHARALQSDWRKCTIRAERLMHLQSCTFFARSKDVVHEVTFSCGEATILVDAIVKLTAFAGCCTLSRRSVHAFVAHAITECDGVRSAIHSAVSQ